MAAIFWSLSRERLFAFCPRAMYLRYIAPAEVPEGELTPLEEERRFCRRIRPSGNYARSVVLSALRDIFYCGNGTSFAALVLRRLARDRHAAERGENLTDSEFPVWSDPENLEAAVQDLLKQPFLPELLETLKRVRPIDRIRLPEVLQAVLADVILYAGPILAWREGARCCILTFESHESVDTILSFYMLNVLKIPPVRVYFLRYDGRREEAMRIAFSLELDHLVYSAGRMYSGVYPCCQDRSRCRKCAFRNCCED